jgi:hypothetical protein
VGQSSTAANVHDIIFLGTAMSTTACNFACYDGAANRDPDNYLLIELKAVS